MTSIVFVCRMFCVGMCVLGFALPAGAGGRAKYDCKFTDGASWNFDKGAFGGEATTPLSFQISKIDRDKQTAELTTETGRTDVKVVAAIDAIHLIEVTVSGYLNLTTIYGDGSAGKPVAAVHSRHLAIVGQPTGGQIKGFCTKAGG